MPRPNDVGVGVAAVIVRDKKVLLLKRKGAHAAGKWSVPGGWIDRVDISIPTVVAREIHEETGLYVTETQLYTVTMEDHEDLNCRTVTVYHRVWEVSGEPKIMEPEKCSEIGWFSWDEIVKLDLFPGLMNVLILLHGTGEI